MARLAKQLGREVGRSRLSPEDISVFDPSGTWLSNWNKNFDSFSIKYLRSVSEHIHSRNNSAFRIKKDTIHQLSVLIVLISSFSYSLDVHC